MSCNQFDVLNFAATLNDACYVQQSMGLRQKLLFATHDPLPSIFSPEFLKEQGADPAMLTGEQREMMEDLFGQDWLDQI